METREVASAGAPDDPAEAPLLSVRLHPHRSLSLRQSRLVLVGIALCCAVTSLPFYLMGAWPVVGFMGLDVLALWVAFRSCDRSARAYEDVHLTMLELVIAKVNPRGRRAEWRFNPSWVRLRRREHEEFGLLGVDVMARGQALEVAAFLGPDQKADFADRLARSLAEAKRGVRFN